jgi:uncharacterized membrane-anchored protein
MRTVSNPLRSPLVPRRPSTSQRFPEPLRAKVPEITVLFWVIKLVSTGMGEAASDFLGNTNLILAGLVGVGGLALALRWQFRTRAYSAPVYWFAVAMVAVFGTMAADVLHVVAGIPYIASTALYAAALAVVFVRWRRSEGTLSIHSIVTSRREKFYWATVFLTFALGTAAGDLTAVSLNLGYFDSAVLFGVLILVPLVAWWKFRLNAVAAFWTAYVLTRPLGASLADWLGKPRSMGGVNLGDDFVTGGGCLIIVVLVAVVARRGHGIQPEHAYAELASTPSRRQAHVEHVESAEPAESR